ncbi:uroporphyrinogen-III C-methyltransferase [bacterium]|nr:uroporphyrinogen-III C-methyltransferase [bacterium]MBU1990636.1 uroporphyrinogen-III C-methyltransferase [bacterium]
METLPKVYLVGCGTGDVELLTIKAYKIIQSVDVVFIDHLIAAEIIEIIPENTKKVFVGKQKGFHSLKQEEINELLIAHARDGLSIARLKSGDPYIFGRGSEEAISLAEEGIGVEVIPGISSALAAPLLAGIAPTARGYATNLSIVSAHLAGNRVNLEWLPLLKMSNHTVVVLMGVSRAKEIYACAKKIGVDMNIDAAVISNASRKNQSVRIGSVSNLESICEDAPRPALIVFGDVVKLHEILPKTEFGE